MQTLTMGELARSAGVGVETIRFYEREGLLAEPERRPSGYRQYPAEAVKRVRFIRHAKELGFSLREIQELLDLRVKPTTTCSVLRQRAQEKVADVEKRVAAMQAIKATLERLVRSCRGKGPRDDCPILAVLDREEESHARG